MEGFVPKAPRDALVYLSEVSCDYFATLQIPVLLGRTFDNRDGLNAPKVAVISQATAKLFFAGTNPIAKQFHMPSRNSERPALEVIGVVADRKYPSVKEAQRSLVFLNISQREHILGDWNCELRTTGETRSVVAAITALVGRTNPPHYTCISYA